MLKSLTLPYKYKVAERASKIDLCNVYPKFQIIQIHDNAKSLQAQLFDFVDRFF